MRPLQNGGESLLRMSLATLPSSGVPRKIAQENGLKITTLNHEFLPAIS